MITISIGELSGVFNGLESQLRSAIVRGLRKSAKGLIVEARSQITRTMPEPDDTHEYKRSFGKSNTKDGVDVGNTSIQSIWIERGRRAGPVSVEGIERLAAWVKRKGLYFRYIADARLEIERTLSPTKRGKERVAKRGSIIDTACLMAATAIARKLKARGYEPRHVFERALRAQAQAIAESVRAEVKRVQPKGRSFKSDGGES